MGEFSVVQDFITRLRDAEDRKDAGVLCELFTPAAKLENLTRPTQARSKSSSSANGAIAFWNQYLHAFDHISSHFTHILESKGNAVLEWHSSGRLTMGTPVEYCGVSILEHDGRQITAFRTYYDSAALLPHAAHALKPFSESVGTPDIRTEASS
ncbi:MAG: nuclear transport factor 2 family protein [Bdellovibrionota bacterium]